MGKIVHKTTAQPKRFEVAKQIKKKPHKPVHEGKGKFNKPLNKGKLEKRAKLRHEK